MNPASAHYLLLQIRNPDDPMRQQEVRCFARALGCDATQIAVFDLISGVPSLQQLDAVDVVLLGGSGDHSVAAGGEWLPAALEAMRELAELSKPTFASCWGFQAMALALGGAVVTDMDRAELGTLELQVTAMGAKDPVFGPAAPSFPAQAGHQDIVDRLPPTAVLLASTPRVTNQAFRVAGKPIYCTQFHPELTRESLLERLRAYPEYIRRIVGKSLEEFAAECFETPASNQLLRRFVQQLP